MPNRLTMLALIVATWACQDSEFAARQAPTQQSEPQLPKHETLDRQTDHQVTDPNVPKTAEDIRAACSNRGENQVTRTLDFPATKECTWGKNGNKDRRQGHVQAMQAQSRDVNLPENAIMCGLEIASISDSLHYDDFLILTLDSYALVVSNDGLLPFLEQKDGIYQWDFLMVQGQEVGFEGDPYCAGNGDCQVPRHDKSGFLDINMDPATLSKIVSFMDKRHTFPISVVATGDNDRGDCEHSDLSLKVNIRYVQTP